VFVLFYKYLAYVSPKMCQFSKFDMDAGRKVPALRVTRSITEPIALG